MKRGHRRRLRRLAATFTLLGFMLIVSAASLWTYNKWDDERAYTSAHEIMQTLFGRIHARDSPGNTALAAEAITDSGGNEYQLPYKEPTIEIDGNNYIGVLEIPKLNLSLPVMEEWSYENLKISPCRYSGGIASKNLVIAAHSYKRHFGDIYTLDPGDDVTFTDAEGTVFRYEVDIVERLGPTETPRMTDSEYGLTLFTCTYDSQNRVTVRCEEIRNAE